MQLSKYLSYLGGGPGSREEQNRLPRAFTLAGLKKNPSNVLIVGLMCGLFTVVITAVSHALKSPDLRINPESREYYRTHQYKWLNIAGRDFEEEAKIRENRMKGAKGEE